MPWKTLRLICGWTSRADEAVFHSKTHFAPNNIATMSGTDHDAIARRMLNDYVRAQRDLDVMRLKAREHATALRESADQLHPPPLARLHAEPDPSVKLPNAKALAALIEELRETMG